MARGGSLSHLQHEAVQRLQCAADDVNDELLLVVVVQPGDPGDGQMPAIMQPGDGDAVELRGEAIADDAVRSIERENRRTPLSRSTGCLRRRPWR